MIVVRDGGTRIWLEKGLRHRIDGPAVERVNGSKEWWICGIRMRHQFRPPRERPALSVFSRDNYDHDGFIDADVFEIVCAEEFNNKKIHKKVVINGGVVWRLAEVAHSVVKPAVVTAGGDRLWAFSGVPGREKGPHIERSDGTKCWVDGRLEESGTRMVFSPRKENPCP